MFEREIGYLQSLLEGAGIPTRKKEVTEITLVHEEDLGAFEWGNEVMEQIHEGTDEGDMTLDEAVEIVNEFLSEIDDMDTHMSEGADMDKSEDNKSENLDLDEAVETINEFLSEIKESEDSDPDMKELVEAIRDLPLEQEDVDAIVNAVHDFFEDVELLDEGMDDETPAEKFVSILDELAEAYDHEDVDEMLSDIGNKAMAIAERVGFRYTGQGRRTRIKLHTQAERRKQRMYYKRHKAKIKQQRRRWERSAAGKKAARLAKRRQRMGKKGSYALSGSGKRKSRKESIDSIGDAIMEAVETAAIMPSNNIQQQIIEQLSNTLSAMEDALDVLAPQYVDSVMKAVENIWSRLEEGITPEMSDEAFMDSIRPTLSVIRGVIKVVEGN